MLSLWRGAWKSLPSPPSTLQPASNNRPHTLHTYEKNNPSRACRRARGCRRFPCQPAIGIDSHQAAGRDGSLGRKFPARRPRRCARFLNGSRRSGCHALAFSNEHSVRDACIVRSTHDRPGFRICTLDVFFACTARGASLTPKLSRDRRGDSHSHRHPDSFAKCGFIRPRDAGPSGCPDDRA